MFFDWLTIEQDFGYQLPILSDVAYQRVHLESGEASALSQPTMFILMMAIVIFIITAVSMRPLALSSVREMALFVLQHGNPPEP